MFENIMTLSFNISMAELVESVEEKNLFSDISRTFDAAL